MTEALYDISAELFERAAWTFSATKRPALATGLPIANRLEWDFERSKLRFVGLLVCPKSCVERGEWCVFAEGEFFRNVPGENADWFLRAVEFMNDNTERRAQKERARKAEAKHRRLLRKQEREFRKILSPDSLAMR